MESQSQQQTSLYIHIPFCERKCRYCDFYSVVVGDDDQQIIDDYIDTLGREWEAYLNSGILADKYISTIYVGGGTPSILSVDMWKRLDDALLSNIDKSHIREWSIECNPESFTIDKARAYCDSGVTRVTFGAQSLDARELLICGRGHSSMRACEVLGDVRLGEMFESAGVDVIYGLPGQTIDTLDGTLGRILSFPHVKHLSAYELTVAEGTPFGRHHKKLQLPDDDVIAEMYELVGKRCAERGMYQYEVSNYALPGFESIHNLAYWSHRPYIGLGASAHSYIHPRRWSNVSDVDQYISAVSTNVRPIDFEETLTPSDIACEMIFLGLRNIGGIDIDNIRFTTDININEDRLQKYVDDCLLVKSSNKLIPTPRGMLFADMMARELGDCLLDGQ